MFIVQHVPFFCRLAGIDRALLGEVVGFLKLFFDASQELEAELCVTLHLAVPWFHKLLAHCAPAASDRSALSSLKKLTMDFLTAKFQLSTEHFLATILNPKMKSLKVISILLFLELL